MPGHSIWMLRIPRRRSAQSVRFCSVGRAGYALLVPSLPPSPQGEGRLNAIAGLKLPLHTPRCWLGERIGNRCGPAEEYLIQRTSFPTRANTSSQGEQCRQTDCHWNLEGSCNCPQEQLHDPHFLAELDHDTPIQRLKLVTDLHSIPVVPRRAVSLFAEGSVESDSIIRNIVSTWTLQSCT